MECLFISVSLGWTAWRGSPGFVGSFGCDGDLADPRIERARAVALRHLGERHYLDARGVARGSELLEALAAQIAQRVHRGFQEFARVEFAFALGGNLAERRSHRQPAIGIDIDLADTVFDAAGN